MKKMHTTKFLCCEPKYVGRLLNGREVIKSGSSAMINTWMAQGRRIKTPGGMGPSIRRTSEFKDTIKQHKNNKAAGKGGIEAELINIVLGWKFSRLPWTQRTLSFNNCRKVLTLIPNWKWTRHFLQNNAYMILFIRFLRSLEKLFLQLLINMLVTLSVFFLL